MKEEETIKQYSDRIMTVVNSIRLLREQSNEARIVEKVLSTLPERDLSTISLTELINALYTQEQRRASRMEEHQEGVFQAKTKFASSTSSNQGKMTWKNRLKPDAARSGDQLCRYCKKPGHPEERCWFRPDATCQHCKKRGHVERVCKNKGKLNQNHPQQAQAEVRVAEEGSRNEEQVFAVSCSAAKEKVTKGWLLDSSCTNHLSPNATIFKSLDRSFKTKVKVGNDHFIKAEGKGDVLINTPTGNKIEHLELFCNTKVLILKNIGDYKNLIPNIVDLEHLDELTSLSINNWRGGECLVDISQAIMSFKCNDQPPKV
ncbi:pleiotropic drug resistance protein 3-like [Gossypium australe]|uniref:Pleiotropic drug resistance protein 3-like n=1 Tax=Gossypium australe TaxID=47621 RepID=A0A5B6VFL7_9ROSI|nr:pleiotropic drug resistance protein 3-like [Gossypium australe]